MKISEKYIESLKAINDWTTVSNWAIKVVFKKNSEQENWFVS